MYLPSMTLGGAERQAMHLAEHLVHVGCIVEVCACTGPGNVADICDRLGITWSILPPTWPCRRRNVPRSIFRLFRIARFIRRRRPDIAIAYCERPCVSVGLARSLVHIDSFIWGQRDVRLTAGPIPQIAIQRATAIVCNAHHEVDFLKNRLNIPKCPIYVVPNGVRLATAQANRSDWRRRLDIHTDTPTGVMVANFRNGKDHSTLLRAWKILLDSPDRSWCHPPTLILAGALQETFDGAKQLANELGILPAVRFPGPVEDIAGLLQASDIGVLATDDEGLPNAILEYMMSGLPVVATDVPGCREPFLHHGGARLVPPRDPQAMGSAIAQLIDHPEVRRSIGTENQERATEAYGIDMMCHRFVVALSQK